MGKIDLDSDVEEGVKDDVGFSLFSLKTPSFVTACVYGILSVLFSPHLPFPIMFLLGFD